MSDNNNPQIQQQEMFSAMRSPVPGEPVLKSLSDEINELKQIDGDEAKKLRQEIGKQTMGLMTESMPFAGRVQHWVRNESPVFSAISLGMDVISWQHALRSDGTKVFKFLKKKFGGSPSV